MKTEHKYKDVIIAWANGEEIQFAYKGDVDYTFEDYSKKDVVPTFDNPYVVWRIKPKVTYKVGDKFRIKNAIYLLSCVSSGHICSLICIEGNYNHVGNRWSDAKIVKKCDDITEEELKSLMVVVDFELLED